MVHELWQEIDIKDRDFVVSYNRKVKHIESIDEIDMEAKFRSLFKYTSSTPRENQSSPIQKLSLTFRKMIRENK